MVSLDEKRPTTKQTWLVLIVLTASVLIGGWWLRSATSSDKVPSSTVSSPNVGSSPLAQQGAGDPPTATLLVVPVANQPTNLQLSLLSEEQLQLMGITVELLFDQPDSNFDTSIDPFTVQTATGVTNDAVESWSTPVNRLDCDGQLCRAQLALISLAPTGIELSNQPFALFTLPSTMTDALKNATIDTTNTVAITKAGETVLLEVPDTLVAP